MKKFFCTILAAILLLSLAACGGNPTESGESLPVCEANGHSWVDATCQTAKTCSVCGKTEGKALAHDWMDANYQAPKVCTLCGITEGEPLTASFVEHGLTVNVTELNTEYDYVTACYTDESKQTVGKLMLSNYRIFAGDEKHPALEGYEWHAVTVTIRFDDENAWNYGCGVETCKENYYDVIGWDESSIELENKMYRHTVNFNGADYTECLYDDGTEYTWSKWVDKACTCTFERYVRVPVGFDGIVLGFRNSGTNWGEGQYIFDIADEDTLFFRLDGTGAAYT